MLAEGFSQDLLETYFCKQYPPRAWKDSLPLHNFGYASTFWNQTVFNPTAPGNVKDENIKLKLDRPSSMSEKIKTKQSFLSSKISSSLQIPTYHTNTTSKLNEYIKRYINKLTTSYINSFCQSVISCSILLQYLWSTSVLLLGKTFSTGA